MFHTHLPGYSQIPTGLSISKYICHFYFKFEIIPVPISGAVLSVLYSPHLSLGIDIIDAVHPEPARTLSFFASCHIQVLIIPAELLDWSIALNSCGKISLSFCIIQSVLMHIIIVLGILLSALHFSIHITTSSISTFFWIRVLQLSLLLCNYDYDNDGIYTLRSCWTKKGFPTQLLHKQRTQ